jgi:hypothetical protein
MNRNSLQFNVALVAEKVVSDQGIKQLPVDPIAIAHNLGIEVTPQPVHTRGVSGMLMRVDSTFGIAYATHINSIGFKNFSIAHELGHYFLPGHIDAVFSRDNLHVSKAGFYSEKQYEIEADLFAARLLMPQRLFKEAALSVDEGLHEIEELSRTCKTSLTATAIRYAECVEYPMAVIVSVRDKVNYCFMSEPLKEVSYLTWIRRGQNLPTNTMTFEFNQDSQRVQDAERDADVSDLQDWFGGDISVQIEEEVQGLGRYGRTLTILTAPDLFDKIEEIKENEVLYKSWEPKFKL